MSEIQALLVTVQALVRAQGEIEHALTQVNATLGWLDPVRFGDPFEGLQDQ